MKSVYDYLADKAEGIQEALKYVTMDIDSKLAELANLREEQQKLEDLLSEFDEFFDKREAIEDVISGTGTASTPPGSASPLETE